MPPVTLEDAVQALEHLAGRAGHRVGAESAVLRRQVAAVTWVGGIRQEAPTSAPFISDRPRAASLSEDESNMLGRLLTAAYYGFFDAATNGAALTDIEEVSRIYGSTLAVNYPEASPAFLRFATTYWTLKALLKRLTDALDSSLAHQLLDRIEQLVGPLFFPYEGPLACDPDERERDQNRFLESFAPGIDREAFQRGNPILIRDRRDILDGSKTRTGPETSFTRQTVLWAELRNADGSLLVPSEDWERILFEWGGLAKRSEERWVEASSGWLWKETEAAALADKLEADGCSACQGFIRRDAQTPVMTGTLLPLLVADGLTTEERTRRLIGFLRKGQFIWRFMIAPYTAPEDED